MKATIPEKSRLAIVRRGLIRIKIQGQDAFVSHPMLDLYEGKKIRIQDDLLILTERGGKKIGTGAFLSCVRATSRPDLSAALVGRKRES
jgi:hypothetical protein